MYFSDCMGSLKRSKTEVIWCISNEPNQTLKSPFGSGNGAKYVERKSPWSESKYLLFLLQVPRLYATLGVMTDLEFKYEITQEK